MPIDRLRRQLCLGAGAASLPGLGAAQSAEWPSARPVRMIVPSAAGGGSDLPARVYAEAMGRTFGQRFIVDNKPGANGMIGNDAAAKSAPDGYTLLFTYAGAVAINQALQPTMPYDALKDLQAIAQIAVGGTFLVVTPDIPAGNLKEFVALIKANPGKYDYGSWGIGSGGHLQMEWLMMHAGLKMNHVPYKATAPMVADLQAGVVRIAFADTGTTLPLIKSGRLKVLAVSGTRRPMAMPEVPTMTEQGFPFNIDAWYGLLAPAGTPMSIVRKLNAEVARIQEDPALSQRLAALNLMPPSPFKSPEQFGEIIRNDIELWSRVIRSANIKPTL